MDNETERPGEACFDPTLDAWILTRHADVSAALRDPRLAVPGTGADGDAAHVAVREAAANAVSPTRLTAWRAEIVASARALTERLPAGVPVDLVGAFARPWAVALAARATAAPPADTERLDRLARDVFRRPPPRWIPDSRRRRRPLRSSCVTPDPPTRYSGVRSPRRRSAAQASPRVIASS